jgi:hypothetical protein
MFNTTSNNSNTVKAKSHIDNAESIDVLSPLHHISAKPMRPIDLKNYPTTPRCKRIRDNTDFCMRQAVRNKNLVFRNIVLPFPGTSYSRVRLGIKKATQDISAIVNRRNCSTFRLIELIESLEEIIVKHFHISVLSELISDLDGRPRYIPMVTLLKACARRLNDTGFSQTALNFDLSAPGIAALQSEADLYLLSRSDVNYA